MLSLIKDKLMGSFHLERIKKQIKLNLLFYKLPGNEIKSFTKLKLTEAKLVPKNQQSEVSQITQIVCEGFVYITLWIDPICTIVIENKEISEEYSALYEILWNHSEDIA